MKTLGNILWHFPFLGFVSAGIVYLLGLLFTATVIAAPIGLGLMEFGKFLLFPFGHTMVSKSDLNIQQNKALKAYSTVVMVLYFPFGLLLTVVAVFQVIGLCLSIVGIPVALVVAKSLGTYLNPTNKKCVSSAVAEELERRKGQVEVDKYLNPAGDRVEVAAKPLAVASEGSTKECPRCAESVKAAAKVCRYCGHEFLAEEVAVEPALGAGQDSRDIGVRGAMRVELSSTPTHGEHRSPTMPPGRSDSALGAMTSRWLVPGIGAAVALTAIVGAFTYVGRKDAAPAPSLSHLTKPSSTMSAKLAAGPLWLYKTADGYFMAKMSEKAEQDDYDGVTSGAVKSKLFVSNISNGVIQRKTNLDTASYCESYRDNKPPERLVCQGAAGPIAGASYQIFSKYHVDQPEAYANLEIISGQDNSDVRKLIVELASELAKTKEFQSSHGYFRFSALSCRSGCTTRGTPALLIEVLFLKA